MKPTFDAHIHIWERPWENFIVGTWRDGRFAQRDLVIRLLDRHGVEQACVLAACNEANPANNEFVADLCRVHHDRVMMFSEIPLLSPKRDQLLDRTLQDWPARGFRYMAARGEKPEVWSGPAHEGFWEKANKAKLNVALNLAPMQAAGLPPLVKRYPQITWLLDHLGRPGHAMSDEEYKPVLDLAAFPNVQVKVSGFYAFTARSCEYPYADLARFVRKLVEVFGPRRLLWGSDLPPVLDFSSYEQTFACLSHHLRESAAEALPWIMGENAKKLLWKNHP